MKQIDLRATIEKLRDFDAALLANTIGYIDSTPAHRYYMCGSIQSVTPSLGPTAGLAMVCEFTGLLTTPFAAYGRGRTVHHCALRFKVIYNRPVSIGGISIRPGDLIHANAEGVIKIPPSSLVNLIPSAIKMRAYEHEAHTVMRQSGLEPAEKRRLIAQILKEYGSTPGAGRSQHQPIPQGRKNLA